MLGQVEFPLLGTANMDDDGSYGFVNDNMVDTINLEVNGKKVTVFGLTNPRVYRYELPTNIPGLTFYSAVDTAMDMVPDIDAAEQPDLFLGLTHVGYQPYGGEVDSDELIAQSVAGLDVIIGGHSHTTLNPAVMVSDPDNNPDGTLVAHARRYAGYLGQVNVGWIGDEMVLREGYLIPTGEAEVNTEMMAIWRLTWPRSTNTMPPSSAAPKCRSPGLTPIRRRPTRPICRPTRPSGNFRIKKVWPSTCTSPAP